jgi:hypothetical protein
MTQIFMYYCYKLLEIFICLFWSRLHLCELVKHVILQTSYDKMMACSFVLLIVPQHLVFWMWMWKAKLCLSHVDVNVKKIWIQPLTSLDESMHLENKLIVIHLLNTISIRGSISCTLGWKHGKIYKSNYLDSLLVKFIRSRTKTHHKNIMHLIFLLKWWKTRYFFTITKLF